MGPCIKRPSCVKTVTWYTELPGRVRFALPRRQERCRTLMTSRPPRPLGPESHPGIRPLPSAATGCFGGPMAGTSIPESRFHWDLFLRRSRQRAGSWILSTSWSRRRPMSGDYFAGSGPRRPDGQGGGGAQERARTSTHFDALGRHECLGLGQAVLAEMKNAGGQYRIGMTDQHAVGQMLEVAHAS